MEHLDFLVWMLGYPICQAVCSAIRQKYCKIDACEKPASKGAQAFAAGLVTGLYLYVGSKLW